MAIFDENTANTGQETPKIPFNLANLPVDALLDLRGQIDNALPARALKDLDMEHELVVQMQIVKNLQHQTLLDDAVPANQKAQVTNSCASALEALIRMQAKYASGERLKQIETHLIETLNRLPKDQTEEFFKWYEVFDE